MIRPASLMALAWLISLSIGSLPAAAQGTVGTLTLDGLSFISFGDEEVLPIPPGSEIRFNFGAVAPDGSIPFTITPADLVFPPIAVVSSGGSLSYSLASAVSGVITPTASGRKIEFIAPVNATLTQGGAGGTFTYVMPFTTEYVSATDLAGTLTIEALGMRMIENVWHVQLVGATVNRENAYPRPGTAVYTVLSGQFDQMP